MANVPKGKKRPSDAIGNAVHVAQIATGEIDPVEVEDDGKDKAAQELGRKGGKARAQKLTAKLRSEIAKKAAAKRWDAPKSVPFLSGKGSVLSNRGLTRSSISRKPS